MKLLKSISFQCSTLCLYKLRMSCCFLKGFSAAFERVKNLPCGETQTFTVKFDPQGANLKMGDTSVVMPIQVHMETHRHVYVHKYCHNF